MILTLSFQSTYTAGVLGFLPPAWSESIYLASTGIMHLETDIPVTRSIQFPIEITAAPTFTGAESVLKWDMLILPERNP